MRRTDRGLVFSPTDLITFMDSEFASWMDRFALERPGEVRADGEDELAASLQAQGYVHERRFLERLAAEGRRIVDLSDASGSQRDEATRAAMHDGAEVIFQGSLVHAPFAGISDFLVRVPGESRLGGHHYEVWDTKLSRKAKPYFVIQLCCYAEMLEAEQGVIPASVAVILGDGREHRLKVASYRFFYRALRERFLAFHDAFDAASPPDPAASRSHGRWSEHAATQLAAADHLCQIAGITRGQVKRLEANGLRTMAALAASTVDRVPGMADETLRRLREQCALQIASRGAAMPRYKVLDPLPGRGFALLPPASPLDVCFDLEGYPLVDGGLEYLWGASWTEGGASRFRDWWAHDQAQEKQALEGFVDWIFARWREDPGMHVYHYGAYEITALRRLMGRYATREHEIDEMLRGRVFVDLYAVVRQALRIGGESYSIKQVELLYRGKRGDGVADAGTSVARYQRWCEAPDGASCADSALLSAIRDYNEDDCISTLELVDWLRRVQSEAGPGRAPDAAEEDAESDKPILDDDESPRERKARVREALRAADLELLAWLVEFHDRERKPMFWRKFERLAMSEDELALDMDCLAGLERAGAPVPEKQSFLHEYRFDPGQETKLVAAKNCFMVEDPRQRVIIHALDRRVGVCVLKAGKKRVLPDRVSLIPDENVEPGTIPEAILAYAEARLAGTAGRTAVCDFLKREPPRLLGHDGGPVIADDAQMVDGVLSAVRRLDHSVLCLQGPPGAGKTYTASQVIAALLADGRRIGIVSNSHKAVDHLLKKVLDVAAERGLTVAAVKAQPKDPEAPDPRLQYLGNGKFQPEAFQLIGGTAWAFTHPSMVDQLDHLFIDEAGQVSIANLVGMGRSTRNIVLMGDQMQLNQPLQGSHPGDSGRSILEFLLQDAATIPPERGVFLPVTWRLHPEICRFISETIYDGRLRSVPKAARRIVRLPAGGGARIRHESGLVYVPVEHDGNTQASDEEVAVIAEIVRELLGRAVVDDKGGERPLTIADILFVAPYNHQVRKLETALGDRASVGSVDRFQGQEAPVVILSMCASDVDGAPRGIEFLFSKNRMNVALSRAQSLAIVVGSPALARTGASSLAHMELLNLYCRLVQEAKR